jgi:hypothetical protein
MTLSFVLNELADLTLARDVANRPSEVSKADIFNVCLVFNHLAGSYLCRHLQSKGIDDLSNRAEALGTALHQAILDNLELDLKKSKEWAE